MNAQRGFTLVELVIVIGIVFTLTAITLPHYKAFLDQKSAEQRARGNTYHASPSCTWWEDKDGIRQAHCKEKAHVSQPKT